MTLRIPARTVLAIAPFVFLLLALLGIAPIHSKALATQPQMAPLGSGQIGFDSRQGRVSDLR
jgi:hypothetical protein